MNRSERRRAERITRQNAGTRAAPQAEVLAPEAILADDPPLVAADADDSLPPDLAFEPVPRAPRSNGLTPARQRLFVKYLALTGSVKAACRAIGCSNVALYNLKHSPGGESFAQAWERAVERGARRVRDVLLEQAIEGIPEKIYKNGELIAERRVFNTRAQMWIAAHYMPERFGVTGGLMHSASGPIGLARLKKRWREEWGRERFALEQVEHNRAADVVSQRISAIRRSFKRNLAADPAKRAAWELLAGPTDWSDFDNLPSYSPGQHPENQTRPDIILTMAAPLGPEGEAVSDVLMGEEGGKANPA